MCGIIGYTGTRQALPLLLEGLERLEYRGYDSAGVAVIDPVASPPTQRARAVGKIAELVELVGKAPLSGTTGIGHTRWATHGRPSEDNAHPHRAGGVSVVHNGIIENHDALAQELRRSGAEFSSETDSEVIAHLVGMEYRADGDLFAAVRRAVARMRGAWALCVVHDDHPHEIVASRNAAPLLVGLGGPGVGEDSPGAETFIASDAAAILSHTRTVLDLEDGETIHIDPTGVLAWQDSMGTPVERSQRRVEWSVGAAEKHGFKHFMLKEIFEQPRAIRDTLLGRLPAPGEPVQLGFPLEVGPGGRILMLACGTSWHAALAGKFMIERLARIPVEVDLASEFRYRDPVVSASDVALAISQSGETADTLAALREAMRRGAEGRALCNVVDSSIARAAQHVLYTQAGPEISVASTKAFTTQLCALALIALDLGFRRGTLARDEGAAIIETLRDLPEAIDTTLGQFSAIQAIARKYLVARDWLFIGRGLGFPVALEGALKLKEISYVHAEGQAAGELKHGPIALVDENVPVVVIATRGAGYDKVLSNLDQVRSRGGRIVTICTYGDERVAAMSDDVIVVPRVHELIEPIVASVPLQLLAYAVADLKGTDVDQPRNLAKSVTVE